LEEQAAAPEPRVWIVPTDLDLADPTLYTSDEVYTVFRHLRDHDPLFWNEERSEPAFWSVTRYEDCVRVLKDPRTFSSVATNVLGRHRIEGDTGSGKMLNATDDPRHSELRQLVSKRFVPRAIDALEPYLRSIVSETLKQSLEQARCDLVDVVAPLPVAGISALLGVPRSDWQLMLRLTTTAFGSHDSEYQLTPDARASARGAHMELLLYCHDLMAARRRDPRDDIVTTLASAETGGKMSEEEALLLFDLLMLGGNETTRHGAVGGILALMQFPDQWGQLKADPALVSVAVDEILRWTSPSRHVLRRARADVELHDKVVRAGDDVAIWHMSANRDERQFREPDVFDVQRGPRDHGAFGAGSHFCLGAALAALELRVFLDEFVRQVAYAELLGPPQRLRSPVINGIKHLPVRLEPEPRPPERDRLGKKARSLFRLPAR